MLCVSQKSPLTLRPFQSEAIQLLQLPGHLICVAPTGSGKSLIYEHFSRHDRVVLVTPLTALARQQHARLLEQGIHCALAAGPDPQDPPSTKTGIWILSPERLMHPPFFQKLVQWCPTMLAVDECHCLWDWGESFRPSFLEIPNLLKTARIERSVWLTATLPMAARLELRHTLESTCAEPVREVGQFALPKNLHLSVQKVSWADRASVLMQLLQKRREPGLIFVQTRSASHRLQAMIRALGVRCEIYHAGMSSEERLLIERAVQSGNVDVVVATSAFGMGMNYRQLQWVILWQAPPSLLALAQAVGRAGRDESSTARAMIFWDDEDFRLLKWMTESSPRRREDLRQVQEFLRCDMCRRQTLVQFFSKRDALTPCNQCDFCDSLNEAINA